MTAGSERVDDRPLGQQLELGRRVAQPGDRRRAPARPRRAPPAPASPGRPPGPARRAALPPGGPSRCEAGCGEHDRRRTRRRRACAGGCRRCPCTAQTSTSGRSGEDLRHPSAGCPSRRAPRARGRRATPAPQSTSRASARTGAPISSRPSGSSTGRSFAEWTARSISPRSRAPLDPGDPPALVVDRRRSAGRCCVTSSTGRLAPIAAATVPAWARASALERVPIRRGREAPPAAAGRRVPAAGSAVLTRGCA